MSAKDLWSQDIPSLKQNFLDTLNTVNSFLPFQHNLIGSAGLTTLNQKPKQLIPLPIPENRIEHNSKPLRFKIPGTQYGGPLYSSGRFYEPNEIITIADLKKVPPAHEADRLYMIHDVEYQAAATKEKLADRIDGLKEADKMYIKRAQDLLKTGNVSLSERGLLLSSIIAFKSKLKSGIGYENAVVDRIMDPKALDAFYYLFPKNIERNLPSQTLDIKTVGEMPKNYLYLDSQPIIRNNYDLQYINDIFDDPEF